MCENSIENVVNKLKMLTNKIEIGDEQNKLKLVMNKIVDEQR
jgi:hypothetical protein